MKSPSTPARRRAFTLIELLTVIAIIGILMALLIPVVMSVIERAKRAQAQNDVMQTITGVKGFYTEYSRYPSIGPASNEDLVIATAEDNAKLYNILRYKGSDGQAENPRGIIYSEARETGKTMGGIGPDGAHYDPWGAPSSTGFYKFVIDTNYDNQVDVNAIGGTGVSGNQISTGVAGMSDGKKPDSAKDDVMSW